MNELEGIFGFANSGKCLHLACRRRHAQCLPEFVHMCISFVAAQNKTASNEKEL